MADRLDKFTERARQVLTIAQDEADRLNHNYIGTELLLLGLLREGEGIAAGVLQNLDVTLPRARSEVIRLLSQGRLLARDSRATRAVPDVVPGATEATSALRRAIDAVRAAKDAALSEQNGARALALRNIETTLEQLLDS